VKEILSIWLLLCSTVLFLVSDPIVLFEENTDQEKLFLAIEAGNWGLAKELAEKVDLNKERGNRAGKSRSRIWQYPESNFHS